MYLFCLRKKQRGHNADEVVTFYASKLLIYRVIYETYCIMNSELEMFNNKEQVILHREGFVSVTPVANIRASVFRMAVTEIC
jgi:hypothetical protein